MRKSDRGKPGSDRTFGHITIFNFLKGSELERRFFKPLDKFLQSFGNKKRLNDE